MVDEPTVEDTISILRGLRERYEVHHGVRIKDAALVAAAILSNRYITDRFLPDKAIDLVDEAAAHACARRSTRCRRSWMRRVGASCSWRSNARRCARRKTRRRKSDCRSSKTSWPNLKEESDALMAQWQAEKDAVQRLRALREQLEQVKVEIEQAERQYDLNRAAELKYGKLVGVAEATGRRGREIRQTAGPAPS